MTIQEAQQIWDKEVAAAAAAWNQEFPGELLDTEWSGTGYQDVPSEVISLLEKDWSDYHDEVNLLVD